MPTRKGNILVVVLAGVSLIVLISVTVAGYLFWQNQFLVSTIPQQPAASSVPNTQDEPANWKTYTDPNNLFKLKYPPSLIPDKKVALNLPPNAKPAGVLSTTSPWNDSQSKEDIHLDFIAIKAPPNEKIETTIARINGLPLDIYTNGKVFTRKEEVINSYKTIWFEGSVMSVLHTEILITRDSLNYVYITIWDGIGGYGSALSEKHKTLVNQILSTFNFLDQSASSQGKNLTVKVFFNNTSLANDSAMLDCSKVFPVNRAIPPTQAVATAAVNEWFKGPTASEVQQGYSGGTKSGNVTLLSLKIVNGIPYADLHFSGPNDDAMNIRQYLGGSCAIISFLSQMGQTIEQFPTVTGKTVFSIDGSQDKFNSYAQNP